MLEVMANGGLGNQMFQYAFLCYLQSVGNDVKLNISDFQVHRHHNGFELERIFGITGPYNYSISKIGTNNNSLFIRSLKKLLHARIVNENEYYENKIFSNIPLKKIEQNILFYGYWQDKKYLECVREKLKSDFSFPTLNDKNKVLYEKLKNKDSVSVHVRRGDYLKDESISSICDTEYYKEAIKLCQKRIDDPVFVFFSDDIKWCRENFHNLKAVFVDWNAGLESYRDMQMMSLCSHNIIANSTFSFWGAWLNNNMEKIVIAPVKWTTSFGSKRICEDNWILI